MAGLSDNVSYSNYNGREEGGGVNGTLWSGDNHNFFGAIIVGQVDGWTEKGQTDRKQKNRQMDGVTDRQTNRQFDRLTDQQTDRRTDG